MDGIIHSDPCVVTVPLSVDIKAEGVVPWGGWYYKYPDTEWYGGASTGNIRIGANQMEQGWFGRKMSKQVCSGRVCKRRKRSSRCCRMMCRACNFIRTER